MQIYQPAMTAVTGQVLGKAYLSQFRDNRDYFFGLVERYRTANEGVNEWCLHPDGATDPPIWDGWHLLRADATLLHCYVKATDCKVKLYYDNVLLDTCQEETWTDETFDLSAKDPGLYRVHFVYEDVNPGEDFLIVPPYTTYTETGAGEGQTQYTTQDVADTETITAAHFNQLKANDAHWNKTQPPQPPFVTHGYYTYTAESQHVDIWEGRGAGYGDRLYYKIEITLDANPDPDDNAVKIYWNGGLVETLDSTDFTPGATTQIFESYVAISGSGQNTVLVTLTRSGGTDYGATVTVWYLYTAPGTAHASWKAIGEYAVGQDVYGNSGGSTQIQYLNENDDFLATWMERKDYASRKPVWDILGKTFYWSYWFQRRFDLLYYRGSGLKLKWGTDQSASLPDVEAGTYAIYDLNNVANLLPGMMYELEGELEFAQEAPW